MKKRYLVGRLRAIARQGGVDLSLLREGRNHEIWSLGSGRLVIPRHREINELTARGIIPEAARMIDQ